MNIARIHLQFRGAPNSVEGHTKLSLKFSILNWLGLPYNQVEHESPACRYWASTLVQKRWLLASCFKILDSRVFLYRAWLRLFLPLQCVNRKGCHGNHTHHTLLAVMITRFTVTLAGETCFSGMTERTQK